MSPEGLPFAYESLSHAALTGTGRLEEADAVVATLEASATALQHRWATPAVLRCRALLLLARGESQAALALANQAAAAFEAAGFPIDRGRALLLAGEALHRQGERLRAAEQLRAAVEISRAVGAALWLERAEGELRRGKPAPPSRPRPDRRRAARRVAYRDGIDKPGGRSALSSTWKLKTSTSSTSPIRSTRCKSSIST